MVVVLHELGLMDDLIQVAGHGLEVHLLDLRRMDRQFRGCIVPSSSRNSAEAYPTATISFKGLHSARYTVAETPLPQSSRRS